MNTNRVAKSMLTALVSTAALLVAPVPAAAVDYEIDYAARPEKVGDGIAVWNSYVVAAYVRYGDYINVGDRASDSMRVAVQWKVEGTSREGLCIWTGGKSDPPGPNPPGPIVSAKCNKNFPEGRTVIIRGGRCDGTVHSCTTPSHYVNFTAWERSAT